MLGSKGVVVLFLLGRKRSYCSCISLAVSLLEILMPQILEVNYSRHICSALHSCVSTVDLSRVDDRYRSSDQLLLWDLSPCYSFLLVLIQLDSFAVTCMAFLGGSYVDVWFCSIYSGSGPVEYCDNTVPVWCIMTSLRISRVSQRYR